MLFRSVRSSIAVIEPLPVTMLQPVGNAATPGIRADRPLLAINRLALRPTSGRQAWIVDGSALRANVDNGNLTARRITIP